MAGFDGMDTEAVATGLRPCVKQPTRLSAEEKVGAEHVAERWPCWWGGSESLPRANSQGLQRTGLLLPRHNQAAAVHEPSKVNAAEQVG